MIDYILTRSKRKTVALYVLNGGVEVRAPHRTPKHEIDRFVASKEKWIIDKLGKSNDLKARRDSFSVDYGSLLNYRGKKYPITAKDGTTAGFDGERFYMPSGLKPERIKAACVQVYRLLAKRDISLRAYELAARMSVAPSAVKISGAKTLWGSCSAKKSLNFSWRLVMAEDELIDYVIAHELAHIRQMNHSAKFWAIVEGILPDYRERRAKLRELQKQLSAENWE